MLDYCYFLMDTRVPLSEDILDLPVNNLCMVNLQFVYGKFVFSWSMRSCLVAFYMKLAINFHHLHIFVIDYVLTTL